ncbi:unnamed protein product [Tilletia laevis]|uniref:T6SS Phospholipase effector Tle1-like catalytic domain-containing protein n=2 Tax=Tilletia TaxID=13289 RepID=A0A177V510_9BASI|nr:hypothetical protein CF336_g1592 [Tilletia laevis]KAE8264169.1 hypothetical protein A4X03_0g1141 [Tilletia caries]CAD6939591.1 unnamed protein product [Tilletia controversa]KAE8207615.1 hypothetical protein CF335_g1022 [Tilletia laevis]CAD6888266.1 unnamed protein product [Tilletia caries]
MSYRPVSPKSNTASLPTTSYSHPAPGQYVFPTVIPSQRDAEKPRTRTLVVCLDGTGDLFDSDISNVISVFGALKKDDPSQICYYQTGIGTYTSNAGGKAKSGFGAALDMAIGSGLGVHVRDAYAFLMQNYREGDNICLFGFSRGAYTARSLAGMLHKVGLLPAWNEEQVVFAYKQFKDDTPLGWKMSADFKRTFCIDVNIAFVGLWDTVASVGIIPRTLPFSTGTNASIRYFRHAIAIDERRAKFKPTLWKQRIETVQAVEKKTVQRFKPTYSYVSPSRMKQRKEAELAAEEAQAGSGTNIRKMTSDLSFNAGATFPPSPSLIDTKAFASSPVQERDFTLPSKPSNNGGIRTPSRRPTVDFTGLGSPLSPGNGGANGGAKTPGGGNSLPRRNTLASVLRRASNVSAGTAVEHAQTDDPVLNESLRKLTKDQRQELFETKFNVTDRSFQKREKSETDVKEVWFLGGHADVGGGAAPNGARHALARIPLRWMIRQTFECSLGILWQTERLAELSLDIHTMWPKYVDPKVPVVGPKPSSLDRYSQGSLPSLASRRASLREVGPGRLALEDNMDAVLPEEEESFYDAMCEINDQLKLSKIWWILEVYPVKLFRPTKDGGWKSKTGLNLGGRRVIRSEEPAMHWTVARRMEYLGYKIRNIIDDETHWRIVA